MPAYKPSIGLILICFLPASSPAQTDVQQAMQKTYAPIDLSLFRDGISHWQKRYGRDRNDARYDPAQIVHIAENLLQYQNPDGGWPVDLDWLAQIDSSEVRQIRGNRLDQSTFDNRNTYPQIDYLAQVYTVTQLDRYRLAVQKGLDYIFREQRPTGGWRGWDVDAITYNDDVMTGIMTLLYDIAQNKPQYTWLHPDLRHKTQQALNRAIDVTLKCQIVVNGQKTAWCQQHDHKTFKPIQARSYEHPSITSSESTSVVRFLMGLSDPGPEITDAIESAITWFRHSAIHGIRIKQVPIDPVRFKNHTAAHDRIVVQDPKAPPIWARFYDLQTGQPFFSNRGGKKVLTLSEVLLERRTGYGWYTGSPAHLLANTYPAWKARKKK